MHMQEALKKHENFFKELERQDRIRQTLKKWDVSKSGGLNKDELGWPFARFLSLLCAPLMCKQSLRADLNTCDIVHAGAMLQDLAGGTAPTEEEVCWWESCARWGGVCVSPAIMFNTQGALVHAGGTRFGTRGYGYLTFDDQCSRPRRCDCALAGLVR